MTGYAIMTSKAFQHFQKCEKHKRNILIEKIYADSVSAGPIYPKHMQIQNRRLKIFRSKPEMCNKTIVFVVFVIFDWSNLINLTTGNGQLDRQESESAKIF